MRRYREPPMEAGWLTYGRLRSHMGSQPSHQLMGTKTTLGYNVMVTCQWATKFMFSFKFYSQCALNLSYIIATETRVRSWLLAYSASKLKVLGSQGLSAGSFCPVDKKTDCTFYKKLVSLVRILNESTVQASVWYHLTHRSSRLHPQHCLMPSTHCPQLCLSV